MRGRSFCKVQVSVQSFVLQAGSTPCNCEAAVCSCSFVTSEDCLLNGEFMQLPLFDVLIVFCDRGLL